LKLALIQLRKTFVDRGDYRRYQPRNSSRDFVALMLALLTGRAGASFKRPLVASAVSCYGPKLHIRPLSIPYRHPIRNCCVT
jgi:hypothetical protein